MILSGFRTKYFTPGSEASWLRYISDTSKVFLRIRGARNLHLVKDLFHLGCGSMLLKVGEELFVIVLLVSRVVIEMLVIPSCRVWHLSVVLLFFSQTLSWECFIASSTNNIRRATTKSDVVYRSHDILITPGKLSILFEIYLFLVIFHICSPLLWWNREIKH